MSSAREMRMRIQGISNISQVTRALEAVSASKVRKAQRAVEETRPYATQAWKVLQHVSSQPGRDFIHPLLTQREVVNQILVVMITGDRGLAGAYNTNIVRMVMEHFGHMDTPVRYVMIGRKGRDLMVRRRAAIHAEFSNLPPDPSFADVSAIGRMAVEEFLEGDADQVFLVYTDYINLLRQDPVIRRLLPLEMTRSEQQVMQLNEGGNAAPSAYMYEPGEQELIDLIVPRFTALQVYQAVLESLASEHAARMVAMRNATENANELVEMLRLDYNKARQSTITRDILDIVGGAEALAQAQDDLA